MFKLGFLFAPVFFSFKFFFFFFFFFPTSRIFHPRKYKRVPSLGSVQRQTLDFGSTVPKQSQDTTTWYKEIRAGWLEANWRACQPSTWKQTRIMANLSDMSPSKISLLAIIAAALLSGSQGTATLYVLPFVSSRVF